MKKKSAMAQALILALVFFSAGQTRKRDVALSQQSRANIRQAVAAVGLILVRGMDDSSPRPRGSGVIVKSDGVVVTNHHVIADGKPDRLFKEIFFALSEDGMAATSEAKRYRLRPVLINREHDLALLRIINDGGESIVFPAIEIGDSQAIKLLDDLTIIGFPEKGGTTVTISRGEVQGKDILGNWIKTDARMIHGNSGGAAVSNSGKLIGIPTKVIADSQPIDKNGDGFPDDYKVYGAVGFLRPAHLVAAMLAQIDRGAPVSTTAQSPPRMMPSVETVTVQGTVKASVGARPVAGALVGLLPMGAEAVTANNLLAWGNTDPDGRFTLNKQIPPGKYTLRVKALGYKVYSRDVEIDQKSPQVVIELSPPDKK